MIIFSLNYNAVFTPNTVVGTSNFTLTVTATATCINDLPAIAAMATSAKITCSILATQGSTTLILVPSYVNIETIPKRKAILHIQHLKVLSYISRMAHLQEIMRSLERR